MKVNNNFFEKFIIIAIIIAFILAIFKTIFIYYHGLRLLNYFIGNQ